MKNTEHILLNILLSYQCRCYPLKFNVFLYHFIDLFKIKSTPSLIACHCFCSDFRMPRWHAKRNKKINVKDLKQNEANKCCKKVRGKEAKKLKDSQHILRTFFTFFPKPWRTCKSLFSQKYQHNWENNRYYFLEDRGMRVEWVGLSDREWWWEMVRNGDGWWGMMRNGDGWWWMGRNGEG